MIGLSAFLDTNILIYALSDHPKTERASEIVARGGVISVQVLNEFVSVMRRKAMAPWPMIEEALADITLLCGEAIALTLAIHRDGLALARMHGLSIYDGMIVAAAMSAGCTTLVSEDLQHGRRFGALGIENPFIA